jgi:hypothetical protein
MPRGRQGRPAKNKEKGISELKIGFLNLPRLWKFVEGDLGGILAWGFYLLGSSRILEKHAMPCHAMHPIPDLFLESLSYVLQIDMHFICTPMWTNFYSCKKWVLHTFSLLSPLLSPSLAQPPHLWDKV